MKNIRQLALATLLAGPFSGAALALDNSDFSQLDQRALGTVQYATDATTGIGFLPSWTLLAPNGGAIRTDNNLGADGDSAFTFNLLANGFGDNKLEQCLPIDPSQSLSIQYAVSTSVVSDDVRTRLNPNFYASMEECEVNLQADDNSNRLDNFADANEDYDQQLGGLDQNQWADLPATVFAAGALPAEAQVLRISLRARDRSGQDAEVLFDNVRVTQGSSPVNLVRNPSFEHLEAAPGDFLHAGAGWQLNSGDRVAAGASSASLSGGHVFYFETLANGFGDSRLDVCVPVDGTAALRPTVRAGSLMPHAELSLRIDLAFFTDADCTTDADSALDIRQDFAIDDTAVAWQTFQTDEQRDAGALAGVASARLSLRARDRTGDTFARAVYLDEATLEDATPAPTFTPPGQEFSTSELVITVNGPAGSTLYYTLDGSTPNQASSALQPGETLTLTATTVVQAMAVLNGQTSEVRSATYTQVDAPFVPPSGPLNRSAGSIGLMFGLFGTLLLLRRR